MSAPGGFAVDPDELETGAVAFAAAARRIADGAPGPAALSAGAFGRIGQVFAGAASEAAGRGVAALAAARTGLTDSADRLRAVAAAYTAADLRAALDLERSPR